MSLGNPCPPSLGNHCFEISYCGIWQVKFHHYKLDCQTFLPHHAHKSTCASLSCALRMAWSRSIRCGHDITMYAWTNLATHGTAFRKGLQKKVNGNSWKLANEVGAEPRQPRGQSGPVTWHNSEEYNFGPFFFWNTACHVWEPKHSQLSIVLLQEAAISTKSHQILLRVARLC